MTSFKHMIAGLAAALLITSAPARADNDAAKVIVGLAGLAVLAKIIQSEREKDEAARAAARAAVPKITPPRVTHRVAPPSPVYRPNARPRHHAGRPGRGYRQCLRQRWTRGGWVTYMDNACIDQVNAAKARTPNGHHSAGHRSY